jgi:SAM-dependent methyltransferase
MEVPSLNITKESFTIQAPLFSANPTISDPNRVSRLVTAVSPKLSDKVLEIACGPGYVIAGFAAAGVHEAVGVDITSAPLQIAEAMREQRKLDNLRFLQIDANHLPFEDGRFDVVVCRLAVHHFANPHSTLGEMHRVCKKNGVVAIEDMYASESPSRAQYWNHFERLRDPSHVRALPISELCSLLGQSSFDIEKVLTYDVIQDAEIWMANTKTPTDSAEQIRKLLEEDREKDLSGTRPWRNSDGRLCFMHRNVILVARKL